MKKTDLVVVKVGGSVTRSQQALQTFLERVPAMVPKSRKGRRTVVLLVISAFGHSTNLIQKMIDAEYKYDSEKDGALGTHDYYQVKREFEEFYDTMHAQFVGLRPLEKQKYHVELIEMRSSLEEAFSEIRENKKRKMNPYDEARLLAFGEQYSSYVVHASLQEFSPVGATSAVIKIPAPTIITTSETDPLSAVLLLEPTQEKFQKRFSKILHNNKKDILVVTEGFIGASFPHGLPTLLGREGSDYSAAIFAVCGKNSGLFENVSLTFIKSTPGIAEHWHEEDEQKDFETTMSWRQLQHMAAEDSKIFHPAVADLMKNTGIKTIVTNLDYFADTNSENKKCTIITD